MILHLSMIHVGIRYDNKHTMFVIYIVMEYHAKLIMNNVSFTLTVADNSHDYKLAVMTERCLIKLFSGSC